MFTDDRFKEEAQELFEKYYNKDKPEVIHEAVKVGDYNIPTYGLTGVLKQAHLQYFDTIIKKFNKLSKVDDVFQLRKAWNDSMKIISDDKTHNIITKKW